MSDCILFAEAPPQCCTCSGTRSSGVALDELHWAESPNGRRPLHVALIRGGSRRIDIGLQAATQPRAPTMQEHALVLGAYAEQSADVLGAQALDVTQRHN